MRRTAIPNGRNAVLTALGHRASCGAWLLCASIALAIGAPVATAAPAKKLSSDASFEGIPLLSIDVVAPPREDKATLVVLTRLAPGQPYRAHDVRRALKLLYQLGRFLSVSAHAAIRDGKVDLSFVLKPAPFVRERSIVGSSDAVSEADLALAVALDVGDEVKSTSLVDHRMRIQTTLERRGYRSPAIGLAVQNPDPNGGVQLVVRVDPGPVTRIRNIVITGQPRRSQHEIIERLGIAPGDVLDLDAIDAGLEHLKSAMKREGFFDAHAAVVRVDRVVTASSGENTHGAHQEPLCDLILHVNAGPKVDIRFRGNKSVRTKDLAQVVETIQELGTEAALADAREKILSLVQRRGFWQCVVATRVQDNTDRTARIIEFRIQEGVVGLVDEVVFPGNVLNETLLHDAVRQALTDEARLEPIHDVVDRDEVQASLDGEGSEFEPIGVATHAPRDPKRLYIARAYQVAAETIADLYRAEGYQAVSVDTPRAVLDPKRRRIRVTIAVTPGPRWTIEAFSIGGNDSIAASELLEAASLVPGGPLSFDQVEASRRRVHALYRDRGFLFARIDEELREVAPRGSLTVHDVVRTSTAEPLRLADVCPQTDGKFAQDTCNVELGFRIVEGPLVVAREVLVRGRERTHRALIDDEIVVRPNEILSERLLWETQRNLQRLGVFRKVVVRPVDPEIESATKDVLIEVVESLPSSLEIGVGASTEEGVRTFATYGHTNVAGLGLRLQTTGKLSFQPFFFLHNDAVRERIREFYAEQPIEYLVAMGWSAPHLLHLPHGFSLGLDLSTRHNNEPAFAENAWDIMLTGDYTALRPKLFGRERTLAMQLRGGLEWADLRCNVSETDPREAELCGADATDAQHRLPGTRVYVGVRPSASFDLRDDPFNPTIGMYFEVQPWLLFGLNDFSPSHLQWRTKVNGYVTTPLWDAVLAVSLVYWRIFALEDLRDTPLPPNRRLFAGGRSTIRGYPEQALVPRDETSSVRVSPGGTLMTALKTELRFGLSERIDGTVFYDVGDLFADPGRFVIDARTRQSIGVGIRYETPIGPLLLDIAVPLVRRDDEPTWMPHFDAVGSF